jgi:hypothetical protein
MIHGSVDLGPALPERGGFLVATARQAALKTQCMKRVCTTTEEVLLYPPFYRTTTKCRNVPK